MLIEVDAHAVGDRRVAEGAAGAGRVGVKVRKLRANHPLDLEAGRGEDRAPQRRGVAARSLSQEVCRGEALVARPRGGYRGRVISWSMITAGKPVTALLIPALLPETEMPGGTSRV